jgi:DHA2 family multidrug resistance protein
VTDNHIVPANRPFIVISIMLATIMQALDTTIANVALPHMQGSLNATQDQISWVLTSYIVAAAIMTPPTGFLTSRLGRKKMFISCVVGFTIVSILCGAATTLPEMVIFRLMQGMFGAGLVPLSQAVLLDIYPKHQHGPAMAMWGVGVMLGPIMGPVVGGWLTEYYNWRWVFYINVPVGIIAMLGMMAFLPDTPKDRSRPLDILGFAMLSIFIGALQLMLDRGETKDWFSSTEIMIEATIAALSFYLFLVQMFTVQHPFLQPGMFKDRNYSTALVFMFVMGIILLATMALLPPYLQNLMGYPVMTTGLMLAPRGIGTMVAMMFAGRLLGKADVRLLIFFGLSCMGWSLWQTSLFTLSIPQSLLVWTGIVQGFGMGFVFVPLTTVAYATLEPRYRADATAFFSLVRNIGSSIGISIMIALLDQNIQINHAQLAEHITPFTPGLNVANGFALRFALPHMATSAAETIINGEVTRQAAAIAYLNDFRLMIWVTVICMPLLLLMKKPEHAAKAEEKTMALE